MYRGKDSLQAPVAFGKETLVGATLDPFIPHSLGFLDRFPGAHLGNSYPGKYDFKISQVPMGVVSLHTDPYLGAPSQACAVFIYIALEMLINTVIILGFPYAFHLLTGTDTIHGFTRKHEL